MKHILIAFTFIAFILTCSATAFSQPVPPPGYHYEKYCYTVYAPFPYSKCEYILVRDYSTIPYPLYRPRVYYPVPHHRYRPAPAPRHHHPAPPPKHNHGPHHGHR